MVHTISNRITLQECYLWRDKLPLEKPVATYAGFVLGVIASLPFPSDDGNSIRVLVRNDSVIPFTLEEWGVNELKIVEEE